VSIRRGVAVDLASGWGGLSLGTEQAGFDIALGVDIEPAHAAAHRYNFPYRAIAGDLAALDGDRLRRYACLHLSQPTPSTSAPSNS